MVLSLYVITTEFFSGMFTLGSGSPVGMQMPEAVMLPHGTGVERPSALL